jgi:ABC-type sulfate transport system permease component
VGAATAVPYGYFNASFYADQAGTATIEGSSDSATWTTSATSALTAATPLILSIPTVWRYYRAKLVNGATIETVLKINTSFTGR